MGALRHPARFLRDHRLTRTRASAYLDGELGPEEQARVEAHTHVCPPCARFVAEVRRTVAALGALRVPARPLAGVGDRVIDRLREEPGRRRDR
ncbi:MAG: zf-HC2 domain-containing protein [Solirubrobacteraceae bacterium]